METSFNQHKYKKAKHDIEIKLRRKLRTPYDYMEEYKLAIITEDYETAKAIDESIAPLGYDVKDTFKYIETLK